MACDINNLVPIRRVVAAAATDAYEDRGKVEHRYMHWAARGLKKLTNEVLPARVNRIILHVSKNTRTATLPPDFDKEYFVGFIDDDGNKIPIHRSGSLTINQSMIEVEEEVRCRECHQSLAICDDMDEEEVVESVVINGQPYPETIIKRFHPNGDYVMTRRTPFLDIDSNEVIFRERQENVVHIERDECGCIEDTPENIFKIKTCCRNVYDCHYTKCLPCDKIYATYNIFEEEGFIQFSKGYPFDKVYLEYKGFLAKHNGQWMIPEVAFETLVQWVNWKSVEKRKNVPRGTKQDYWNHYLIEKGNMNKILGRVSLAKLMHTALSIPKFD